MNSKFASRLIICLTLTFLIGPFLIIILAGLSAGDFMTFPPDGISLKWYIKVFTVESFRESFWLSMFLAVFGTICALVLGIPAAYAISRYDLPYSETIKTIVAAPIIVPGIIVGLALLRYLVVPLNFTVTLALFMAHTALVLPCAHRVFEPQQSSRRHGRGGGLVGLHPPWGIHAGRSAQHPQRCAGGVHPRICHQL